MFNELRRLSIGLVLLLLTYGIKVSRGVETGGIWVYIYPPKSIQVDFLWGKNDVKTLLNMSIKFYTSQQFYTPKTNFWLRP